MIKPHKGAAPVNWVYLVWLGEMTIILASQVQFPQVTYWAHNEYIVVMASNQDVTWTFILKTQKARKKNMLHLPLLNIHSVRNRQGGFMESIRVKSQCPIRLLRCNWPQLFCKSVSPGFWHNVFHGIALPWTYCHFQALFCPTPNNLVSLTTGNLNQSYSFISH